MRLLVDAQLPPALARWLADQGHEADHVADLGMTESPDTVIWTRAQKNGSILITKDEDFVILRTRRTEGPQIVWIRKGNVSRKELLTWMAPLLGSLCASLQRGEVLVEIS